MLKEGKILIGKAGETEVCLLPHQMNRHGLIAGASGTGKTVTLKVIAESLSELGVPTFIADVKGDLSGMINPGDMEGIRGRLDSMGIEDYEVRKYPVHFFDVYREYGHPIRSIIQDMDPVLLSRILDLTDAQQGVMNIIFRVAEELDLEIIDLKDLQLMTAYVGDHAKEYTIKYGNVSRQSVGAIQRKLLELEQQQGALLFGMPSLSINDLISTEGGMGMMSILECEKLFQHPLLYSTFLLWLLDKLYNELPEVGDLDKPKIIFFFDEAHLLFDNASRQLLDKINQIIKLIRSKGVGIFFCTQSPADIPDTVLAQLSNRIQHALRAYTPNELKVVKKAADSFRPNPDFVTADLITNMKTGYALVSVLEADGAPCIVQHTKILPPKSSMVVADETDRKNAFRIDSIYGKYENDIDPDSAYEMIPELLKAEEEERLAEEEAKKQAKIDEAKAKAEAREAAKKKDDFASRFGKKLRNKMETEVVNAGARTVKKFLKGLLK